MSEYPKIIQDWLDGKPIPDDGHGIKCECPSCKATMKAITDCAVIGEEPPKFTFVPREKY